MRALSVLLVLAAAAWPQTFREKRPGKAPKGKLCAWTTKGGLHYLYRVPKHVREIRDEVGTSTAGELENRAWVGHVRAFHWGFRGVPARDKFEGEWRARLTAHDNRARPHLERFARLKDTDQAGAFAAVAAAVRIAPLATGCQGTPAMEALVYWRRHYTKEYRLAKADVRTAERFCTPRDEGIRAYLSVNQSYVPR